MTSPKPRLLASAPTIADIESVIGRFYYSDKYRVDPETLAISHPDKPEPPKGVRVVFKARRYRFEMVPA